jgi:hypothetical protein
MKNAQKWVVKLLQSITIDRNAPHVNLQMKQYG